MKTPPTLVSLPVQTLASWVFLHLCTTACLATTFLSDGHAVRVWQTDDGLPQNMVTCGVQTRDGYLWFGTPNGLTRFDGERFRVFEPANTEGLMDRRITRLYEDAEGTLWIGHNSGLITRRRDGHFEPLALPAGHVGDKVIGLGSDGNGRMWAMRENGTVESLEGGTRLRSLIGEDRPGVMSFSRGAGGHIWLSQNGQTAQLSSVGLVPISLQLSGPDGYVLCVATAHDGGAWIMCEGRIRKWDGARWSEDRGGYPWPRGGVACGLELRDGTLAIGTLQSGLYLIPGDGRPPVHFGLENGLPQNWVRFLYEDREGTLWAGAGSAGLVSIRTSPFAVVPLPDETLGCSALSVAAEPDGSLWVGTDGAALYHHTDQGWVHYGADEGLPNAYIPSVAVSPEGAVWASDFWWGGPYRLEEGRFIRPAGIESDSNPAYSLLPLEDGGLLVGNRDGLRQWKDGRSTWLVRSAESSAPEVYAIARDRRGTIWCGFGFGGVARLADGQATLFRRTDGLASDAIHSLCIDDDDTLWIGTADRGLSRLKDGRFATINREHGLVDDVVCSILDDGLGCLWLSTHKGIQRITKSELNRCADGASATFSSQVFDRSDGLPIIEFTSGFQPVACKAPDGRLWFTSSKGLVSVDPSRIESNPIPPPVVIDSMWRDGHAAPISADTVVDQFPPDHERLEFRFSGLSFVSPDRVLFKYRLDGIDRDWIDSGTKRSAFYSRLSAGTYRFRVIACNNDGVWNTNGASLAFTVAPFFWQTWWFVSACSLVGLSAFALMVRFITRRRMQRRMQELQRQNALERERARIAQDIHDDVGSSLARIAMLSQPARGDLAEPQRTAAVLSRIYSTAREVTKALDEIVWAVDPRHDTLDSLVSYMGKFAQDYLAAADVRCRLDPPVELPAWRITAETRHNLFLAFKEALNNVLKHAGATEVRVSLSLLPEAFVLTIRDNGRGFDPRNVATNSPGRIVSGHGLPNMSHRLASIGGRCDIAGGPGQGTSISFHVSIPSQTEARLPQLRSSLHATSPKTTTHPSLIP